MTDMGRRSTAVPAGAGTLVRVFLRRDRWLIPGFVIGNALLFWSQAPGTASLYANQAEFDRAAASEAHNAAFIAMTGPPRALNTLGGQVAWQATAYGAIVIALLAMLIVGRHTRAEEESGRDELLRSAVVGREAPLAAAMAVVGIASGLSGLAVALSLIAYGLGTAGAVTLGLGVASSGVAFGAVALVAAQLASSTRTMYGLTGLFIASAFVLRAIGDLKSGHLSWISPIGWFQAMHAYSGNRWWPATLLLVLAALAMVLAFWLFRRRDIGSGVLAERAGPSRARAGLLRPWGLPWRLQRGAVTGWAGGIFLLGIGFGSIGNQAGTFIGDSQYSRQVFGAGADLVESFYAVCAGMLALTALGFTVSSALRPRGEERDGRAEVVLATSLSRRTWLVGHAGVTMIGSLFALTSAGLGMGLGYTLATGEGDRFWDLVAAPVLLLPAVLLLDGLARLLYGLAVGLSGLVWVEVVLCVVVVLFARTLHLPTWVLGLSPFHHLSAFPSVSVDWWPLLTVSAVAVAMSMLGTEALLRRDMSA